MMMPELMDEWFDSKLLRGSLSSSGIKHLTQGPYSAATVLNFLHQHMFSNGIMNLANPHSRNQSHLRKELLSSSIIEMYQKALCV